MSTKHIGLGADLKLFLFLHLFRGGLAGRVCNNDDDGFLRPFSNLCGLPLLNIPATVFPTKTSTIRIRATIIIHSNNNNIIMISR